MRQTQLQHWLDIEESTKPKVYTQVFQSARIASVNYWLEIVFSASIATFGLVLNSPAVIIGAMLISPLMGPIMAAGLALAVGDLYLAIKAIANVIASVVGAVLLSAFGVWLLPFHSATSEIVARSNPNLLDLGVAVFSGLAGSVVVSRGGGAGGVTALPGVAIAVALMPPLCTMGFGLGSGGNTSIIGGAGLLFLTNLVAIVSSAFLVFFLVGMNSTGVVAEMRRVEADDVLARFFARGPLGRTFGDGGQVRWRILILIVLLGAIAVPLRRALLQVASETVARGTVQNVVKTLFPADALMSQQVQIGNENILIRLLSTKTIPQKEITRARQLIASRTGRSVELTVQEVASKSELAEALARLSVPAPPPQVKTIEEMRQEIVDRVAPVIKQAWPPEVPLESLLIALDETGIVCNITYQATHDLGELPLNMIRRDLQEKLQTQNISLSTKRIPPPRAARQKK